MFLSLLIALSQILICCPVYASDVFEEVSYGHWSYQAVDRLARRGVIEDYQAGLFNAAKTVTRYEMALYIAELLTDMNRSTPESVISDAYRKDLDIVDVLLDEYRGPLEELGFVVHSIKDYIGVLRLQKNPPVEKTKTESGRKTGSTESKSNQPSKNKGTITPGSTAGSRKGDKSSRPSARPVEYYDEDGRKRHFIGHNNRDFRITGRLDSSIQTISASNTTLFNADNSPEFRGVKRDLELKLRVDEITPDNSRPWFGKINLHIEDFQNDRSFLTHDIFVGRDMVDLRLSNEMLLSFNEFGLYGSRVEGGLATARDKAGRYRLLIGNISDGTNVLPRTQHIALAEISQNVTSRFRATFNQLQIKRFNNIDRNDVTSMALRYKAHRYLNLSGELATSSTKGTAFKYHDDNNAFKFGTDLNYKKGYWKNEFYDVKEHFISLGNRRLRPETNLNVPRAWYEYNTTFTYRFSDMMSSSLTYRDRLQRSDDTDLERDEATASFTLTTPRKNRVTMYYLYQRDHGVDTLVNKDNYTRLFTFRHGFPLWGANYEWGFLTYGLNSLEPTPNTWGKTTMLSAFANSRRALGHKWHMKNASRYTWTDIKLSATDMSIHKKEWDFRLGYNANHKNRFSLGGDWIRQTGRNHLTSADYEPYTKIIGAFDYDYQFDEQASFRVEYRDYFYRDVDRVIAVTDESYSAESLKVYYQRKF